MSDVAVTVNLTAREVLVTAAAMDHYVEQYRKMEAAESVPAMRADLHAYVLAGGALHGRFRAAGEGAMDLTPGEMATLDRALRMRAAYIQQLIRPSMPEHERTKIKARADEVSALLLRCRQAKGLPW